MLLPIQAILLPTVPPADLPSARPRRWLRPWRRLRLQLQLQDSSSLRPTYPPRLPYRTLWPRRPGHSSNSNSNSSNDLVLPSAAIVPRTTVGLVRPRRPGPTWHVMSGGLDSKRKEREGRHRHPHPHPHPHPHRHQRWQVVSAEVKVLELKPPPLLVHRRLLPPPAPPARPSRGPPQPVAAGG